MELSGWKDCRWKENHALSLIPPVWETFQTIYREVANFVSKFPFRRRLVVFFVFRGSEIKVDLGDVKAAGIVCALGIGFSVGTFLIYKLYSNYIRPALNKPSPPPEKIDTTSEDEDCYIYVGSTDSSTGFKMGNSSSSENNEPPVHYSAQYGVAFGTDYRKKKETITEGVRLRSKRRNRQPSVQSDKDSAIGVSSELGQSFYSDAGFNRDSFYSTCTTESGFENMQESYDESCEGCSRSRVPSLKGTYSPRSYNDRHGKYIHEHTAIPQPPTTSSQSVNNKTSVLSCTIDEENSPSHSNSLPRTVIEAESSPSSLPSESDTNWDKHDDKNMLHLDYDPSLDQSESLSKFSGCASSLDSSSWDGDDKNSPLPRKHGPSDTQFRQSLMNRLKEWSNRSFDFVSRSPTPEVEFTEGLMRRSRSLDRQMSLMTTPDCALFENETLGGKTTENLEHIEDELHGIQDEFEEITSQINALINRSNSQEGVAESDGPITFRAQSPVAEQACYLVDRVRQHLEQSNSLPLTDSVSSSRASSVELSWDLDVDDDIVKPRHRRLLQTANNSADNSESSSGEHSEKNSPYRKARHSPRRILVSDGMSSKAGDNSEVFLDSIDETAESQPKSATKVNKKMNIGEALDLEEYADKEWKGDTDRAKTIKQGYKEVIKTMKCKHLRQIRGDNYCAIRGSLYQMLTTGSASIEQWPSVMNIIDKLKELYEDPTTGLANWTFGNRFPVDTDKLSMICKCVLTLYSTIELVNKIDSYDEKVKQTLKSLNSHPDTDVELMEGVKLLMLVKAVELFKDNQKGKDLPIFACLMFARDTSETLSSFVANHLNPVGDSGGLEQVEMCLLGQTIGTVISVARLAQFGAEDFLCKFPDDSPSDWSIISLIAEDDRHYNVPIP
ncbi:hypothetical protein SNE40_003296 [Patella caerulea]|uniref:Uncharacterized protein n=1 Tax=Patella caerulea TaxID=87958 RepID=A0AAN8KAV1_PATCE